MYKILRPKSWEIARKLANFLIQWGFRGQSDISWGLETTLHRGASQFGFPFEFLANREAIIVEQFQRRAHHYLNHLPNEDQWLDWLATIQHYGGPTRLLDFSHSFYVSTFFATEKATGDAAIWGVNLAKLEKILRTKLNIGAKSKNENIYHTNNKLINIVEDYLHGRKDDKLVIHVEPNRLHERLSIQNGLFLVPCSISSSFEKNLIETFDISEENFKNQKEEIISDDDPRHFGFLSGEASILKIIIPRGSHKDVLDDLKNMNINSATLFPGLDGFARSLFHHLRAFELGNDFKERLESIKNSK